MTRQKWCIVQQQNRFHKDAREWDYFVKRIKCDGRYYDVVINVKDTGGDQYVYDIILNEAASLPDSLGSENGSSTASTNSISQINEKATKDLPLREDLQKKQSLSLLEEKLPIGEGIYGKDIVLDHPVRTDIKAVSTENEMIPEELPPHMIKVAPVVE